MSNLKTLRYRTIVIQLPVSFSTGQEVTFPDQDDLREAIIEGYETFTADDQFATPGGQPVIEDAESAKVTLIFAHKSNDRIKYTPYRTARAVLMAGQIRQLSGWAITWPQCRVRCVSDLGNGQVTNLLIGIHFRYPTDVE